MTMRPATVTTGRRVTVEAVVIRADGSRVNLGVIASSDPDGPGIVRGEQANTETEET